MGRLGARRRRRWAAAVLAAVAASSLVLVAGSTEAPPWAEQAVEWMAARDLAAHRSVAELVRFDSPRTVHLLCCNQGEPIKGREALADFLSMAFGESLEEGTMGRSYVDVSGAVVEYRFPADPVERSSGGTPPAEPDEAQVSEIAGDGGVTQTVHATSLQFLESPVYDGRAWYGGDLRAARPVIDRYLSAWSRRDAAAVGGLYAEDATLLDSLLGVRLKGRSVIASYDAAHGGARLRPSPVPAGGGPAVYAYWSGYQSHLNVFLAYTGDDGNGCPGGAVARLQIERGRIVAERRYHDVASMRRCVNRAQLPDGWWTHAAIPPPAQDQVTGTVTAAGRQVEVHNGTAGAEELVRWAMARFPAARLGAPRVAFVAFGRDAHPEQCSGGTWGMAVEPGSSARVYLCLRVDRTTTAFQRSVALHELAHAWMWQNLDEEVQRQFVTRVGLPGWDAPAIPWEKRGIEQAADVIAWGLGDDPLRAQELSTRSCAELTAMFRLLTGAAPLQPSCPPLG
ncbi:MAG TPA: hypothetical protein VFP73_03655 [Terrabacter sp.]|nr:hypothetical protein [Terrabacter sp.]